MAPYQQEFVQSHNMDVCMKASKQSLKLTAGRSDYRQPPNRVLMGDHNKILQTSLFLANALRRFPWDANTSMRSAARQLIFSGSALPESG